MPRGEETQVPPQEEQETSREVKAQDEVREAEARRDAEAVSEPEAVVERERPVEESEAIEAAVIEAVEAAMPPANVELRTEEGGEMAAASGEEVSATPITLPKEDPDGIKVGSEEVSATPITLPKEDPDGIKAGSDEISATPITLPKEDPDGIKAGTDQVSATPITLPKEDPDGIKAGTDGVTVLPIPVPGQPDQSLDESSFKVESSSPERDEEPPKPPQGRTGGGVLTESLDETSLKVESHSEVEEAKLDENSFKFFTPTPDHDLGQETSREELRDEAIAQETSEVLGAEDFKPIPAEEDGLGDADTYPLPLPDPTMEGNGVEDQGGSILIGEEEEELEQIDMSAEAAKEVEEYWEPPEMYIYTAEDGTQTFVDADGNPIKCPPQYYLDKESGSKTAKAWYPGGTNVQAFDVPPFPGYMVDEFYVIEGKPDPSTGKTTYILVDRNGNPVKNQPEIKKDPNFDDFSYQGEGEEGNIPVKLFSESNILIYTAADGSKTLVDSKGNPIKCPPMISGDPEAGYFFKGPQGEKIQVNDYSPQTTDIYIYTAPDGTKTVVDSDGNPVKCPPPIYGDPEAGFSTAGSQGEKITLDAYVPPVTEVYVYIAQDGTKTIVDKDGNPVKYPPQYVAGPGGDGFFTQGSEGEKIEIATYEPTLTGIYVYTAQDGTKTVVDSSGNPVKCPPPTFSDGEGAVITKGSEGQKVEIPDYNPPIDDIYVYTAADGTRTVVDKYGDPVKSPPHIWNNPSGEGGTVINGPDGKPLLLSEYKPISSHWDKKIF